MKNLSNIELEKFNGGVMQHPDCDEWFMEAVLAFGDGDLNTMYDYVVKMETGGCNNPL